MCRLLIIAVRRCLQFAMRSRKIGCSRTVDESNLPSAGIDHHQQLQPNLDNHESICLIPCMSGFLTCFSGRHHDPTQPDHPDDATEEAQDNCNNFRSVWFAASDPATATADRNYLMVHASLRYAIFI